MFVVDNVAFEDNGFVLLPFKYIFAQQLQIRIISVCILGKRALINLLSYENENVVPTLFSKI